MYIPSGLLIFVSSDIFIFMNTQFLVLCRTKTLNRWLNLLEMFRTISKNCQANVSTSATFDLACQQVASIFLR